MIYYSTSIRKPPGLISVGHVFFSTSSSVRGEAGSDVVSIFYEKVTALTGDQPPVVMVTSCLCVFQDVVMDSV